MPPPVFPSGGGMQGRESEDDHACCAHRDAGVADASRVGTGTTPAQATHRGVDVHARAWGYQDRIASHFAHWCNGGRRPATAHYYPTSYVACQAFFATGRVSAADRSRDPVPLAWPIAGG